MAAAVLRDNHVQHRLPLCVVSCPEFLSTDNLNRVGIAMTDPCLQDRVHTPKKPNQPPHSLRNCREPNHAHVKRLCRYTPLPPSRLLLMAHQRRSSDPPAEGHRSEDYSPRVDNGRRSPWLHDMVLPLGATPLLLATARYRVPLSGKSNH